MIVPSIDFEERTNAPKESVSLWVATNPVSHLFGSVNKMEKKLEKLVPEIDIPCPLLFLLFRVNPILWMPFSKSICSSKHFIYERGKKGLLKPTKGSRREYMLRSLFKTWLQISGHISAFIFIDLLCGNDNLLRECLCAFIEWWVL
ncbi:hypothetical protein CDAR_385541 [Caerostris darwini]|uniref:Uncharacterized protein n=1 Tax=Caerostris darwini TaxID=1538125 RepID=A0AAV4M3R7_9ARAC|nr:hypothetical protein CDAR_385541 [Caerostris darwini]